MGLKIARALLRPPGIVSIVLLGTYMCLWGLWVGNPWWTVFDRAPVYGAMAQFAPEWFYGSAAFLCGALILHGGIAKSYTTLSAGSLLGTVHWVSVCTLFVLGDWQNTGGITTLFVTLHTAYLYLSTVVNQIVRAEEKPWE